MNSSFNDSVSDDMFSSHTVNVDGTPMVGSVDIRGHPFGVTDDTFSDPAVNIDGTSMAGSVDIYGNPFDVTNDTFSSAGINGGIGGAMSSIEDIGKVIKYASQLEKLLDSHFPSELESKRISGISLKGLGDKVKALELYLPDPIKKDLWVIVKIRNNVAHEGHLGNDSLANYVNRCERVVTVLQSIKQSTTNHTDGSWAPYCNQPPYTMTRQTNTVQSFPATVSKARGWVYWFSVVITASFVLGLFLHSNKRDSSNSLHGNDPKQIDIHASPPQADQAITSPNIQADPSIAVPTSTPSKYAVQQHHKESDNKKNYIHNTLTSSGNKLSEPDKSTDEPPIDIMKYRELMRGL